MLTLLTLLDEIAHIKKFIASAGTYANLVRQAKSKQKIIDKMHAAGLVEKVDPPKTVSFKFENVRKLSPPIISFNDVSFSYDGKSENALYKNLSFGIDMDSRIALVGKNGTGKSTLLNLIMGLLIPTTGSVSRNSGLKLAKYCQHSADQLPYDRSPLDYIHTKFKDIYPGKDVQQWRSHLGRFGISGGHQTAEIRTLSDGLKSRVVFAELALETPHILLLDEPTVGKLILEVREVLDCPCTANVPLQVSICLGFPDSVSKGLISVVVKQNHLDIASIDALAKACNAWTGGIVLVSHDFRLIEQICLPGVGELWEVKHNTIVKLDITIHEYKHRLKTASSAALDRARVNVCSAMEDSRTFQKILEAVDSILIGALDRASWTKDPLGTPGKPNREIKIMVSNTSNAWTKMWMYGMGGFFGAAAVICAYKPEANIAAWARERAEERARHAKHLAAPGEPQGPQEPQKPQGSLEPAA
ncbi:uncharacterized protein T551_01135 [Pneumocystis jirovecii RU7]|uniref:NADH dehydrogenase [ubiquinone] 1 beta subcomplex subunit 11, mitochondrial n=1 Tax=Pneumocystis jirovecii (strain RU7) TaxID=1408657 RepID=A0A0W4ZU15_PNEJ7|nr:uncharacterized protein T551_01135 [Pneumocystis jirovecii RU7]KTW31874.1 hypothetical protein T551_01135 [Pneumocystis jirovecii RU7]